MQKHSFHKQFLSALACVFIFLVTGSVNVFAADYYPNDPSEVAGLSLEPGDRVFFEGGKTYTGKIYLGSNQQGTAEQPIEIASHGEGRATIKNIDDNAFFAFNTSGIYIHDINFEGPGSTYSNQVDGVGFYMDLANTKLPFIRLENSKISGWTKHGLYIGSWNGSSGFKDVTIRNVEATDNVESGIFSYAQNTDAHQNIYVGYSNAHHNPGKPGLNNHSGNGIMLSGIKGGLIEHNQAYNNGTLHNFFRAGPVGIWAYDASDLVFQFNESYNNKTSDNGADGGGFDIEGGTNVVFQYNYSHDNDGAGFGLYQYSGAAPWENNVVRYNLSVNDGRKNQWYGGISSWAANGETMNGAQIYNNTIYMSHPASTNTSGIAHLGGDFSNFNYRNNNIYVRDGAKVLRFDGTGTGTVFQGNNYFSGDAFNITWNGESYDSLENWRQATNLEKLNGQSVGGQLDPLFVNAGGSTPESYKIQDTSPLVNLGLDLNNLFSINIGSTDYFGSSFSSESIYDIGFHEYTGVVASPSPSPSILPSTLPSPTPSLAPSASPIITACVAADLNNDGFVNILDFSSLISNFFSSTPDPVKADINQDGIVNIFDYSLMFAHFFEAC